MPICLGLDVLWLRHLEDPPDRPDLQVRHVDASVAGAACCRKHPEVQCRAENAHGGTAEYLHGC